MKLINSLGKYVRRQIEEADTDLVVLSVDLMTLIGNLGLKQCIPQLMEELVGLIESFSVSQSKSILLQTFDLTFPQHRLFDVKDTAQISSALSKALIKIAPERRTQNPMYSFYVSNLGKQHLALNRERVFGNDSIYEFLIAKNTQLITLGHHYIRSFTNLHHVERLRNANYRFDKTFKGIASNRAGETAPTSCITYARKIRLCSRSGLTRKGERSTTGNTDVCKVHHFDEHANVYGFRIDLASFTTFMLDLPNDDYDELVYFASPISNEKFVISAREALNLYSYADRYRL